ncbi:MAG: hypothetical protein KC561_13030, partial [Myxococcales bacterium]|nr:hypothetical protein [Myxococcales bacterium]
MKVVRYLAFSALIMPAGLSFAQDGNYLDYGGVQIPVPSDNPTTPDFREPSDEYRPNFVTPGVGDPGQGAGTDSDQETLYGNQSGRTVTGDDGAESSIYQSTRVSEVVMSNARDRFNWFYNGSDLYSGVIPNVHDSIPQIAAIQQRGATARNNSVTWLGFQALPSTTRVFVQLARTPDYTVAETEDGYQIQITLQNTRLSLSNFNRYIDASHFGRSV